MMTRAEPYTATFTRTARTSFKQRCCALSFKAGTQHPGTHALALQTILLAHIGSDAGSIEFVHGYEHVQLHDTGQTTDLNTAGNGAAITHFRRRHVQHLASSLYGIIGRFIQRWSGTDELHGTNAALQLNIITLSQALARFQFFLRVRTG